jgi:hypothetical protein
LIQSSVAVFFGFALTRPVSFALLNLTFMMPARFVPVILKIISLPRCIPRGSSSVIRGVTSIGASGLALAASFAVDGTDTARRQVKS